MNRRDTIIVAVLINACLLIVLFATAITKKEEPSFVAKQTGELMPKIPEITVLDIEREPKQESSFALAKSSLSKPTLPETFEKPQLIEETKAPAKPQETPLECIQITVKRGDVLERLARENNTKVEEIMRLNDLATTQLRIGQVLKIPANQSKKDERASNKPAIKQYVVVSGDTLWHIAKKHNMQVSELLKINRMSSESANRLQPGDTLLVH